MIPELKNWVTVLCIGRTLPFGGKADHLGQKGIYYIPLRQGGLD
jgi:hypothetical protein